MEGEVGDTGLQFFFLSLFFFLNMQKKKKKRIKNKGINEIKQVKGFIVPSVISLTQKVLTKRCLFTGILFQL